MFSVFKGVFQIAGRLNHKLFFFLAETFQGRPLLATRILALRVNVDICGLNANSVVSSQGGALQYLMTSQKQCLVVVEISTLEQTGPSNWEKLGKVLQNASKKQTKLTNFICMVLS